MEEDSRRNIRLVVIFIGLALLMVIGYFIYRSIITQGKVEVEVVAVPGDATITLNNEKISTGTVVYLKAGEYTVKASKEGYADFSSVTSIKDDVSDQIIAVPLEPVSSEAKKWAEEHQNDYLALEGKSGESAQKQGEEFQTQNPIITHLPSDSLLYTIGYKADPSDPTGNSIILEIDAADGYRQAAIYQISQWGYNPADFKINFRNYKNPFSS